MAEQRPDLVAELRALGRELPAAPSGDVADAVMARIAGEPVPRPGLVGWLRQHWRAVVAGLAGLLVVLVITPPVRATMAEWFGLGGVVVRHEPGPRPSAAPPPPLARGDLTLAEARRLVDFEPVLPRALGEPDGIEVSADRRVLSMTWSRGPDGVLRLDQLDGRLEPRLLKSAPDVEFVLVGSRAGLWIPGPHSVVVLEPDGRQRTEQARLAAKTLIWEYGEITLRLEGDLNRDRAVAIAESVEPA